MKRSLLPAVLLLSFAGGRVNAQGNLSTQGFGYPTGQLSTTALSLGGGSAELDPASAINPASVALWGAGVLFMQYEPELRTVKTSSASARTTTARFPMIGISAPLGRGLTAQASASAFLDRTWSTSSTSQRNVGGTVVDAKELFSSKGGITDFRLALAYNVSPRFQVGVAGHIFSGANRIVIEQQFPDTVAFTGTSQRADVRYGALGASAGLIWRPSAQMGIAASVRAGGNMKANAGDTLLSSAKLPMRYGVGMTYSGISGVSLFARANFDGWSAMEPLRRAGSGLRAYDSWDYGVGADVAGPTIGRRNIALRVGARYRGLPFGVGSTAGTASKVNELALSGGFGVPLGIGRSQLDVGVVRASRRPVNGAAAAGATESAYIFSFGIRVRP